MTAMHESTAWRILAEEHDAERTKSAYLCMNLKYQATGRFFFRNSALAKIPADMRGKMQARIEAALGSRCAAAYHIGDDCTDDEARESRVLACLLFAAGMRPVA